jgi:uncharacterized protein YjaG (DUF416 family)
MFPTDLDGHYRALARGLATLSPRHQLVFAASCAEVLKANYRLFVADTGWGDAELLEVCVEKVWECATGTPVPEVSGLIERCKKIAPDTEDFDEASTSVALNAVSAAVSALKACTSPSIGDSIDAAAVAIDTVWGFVQIRDDLDPNDPALEKKILGDRLMDGELARQRQILQTLRTIPALDAAAIDDIRQASRPLIVRHK